MERESFQSRLGFILVSAGCAIGIGNVWMFPYVAGQNGGGLFVLIYLLFLAIMGVPILTMELAIGRGSGLSIVRAYKKTGGKGQQMAYPRLVLSGRLLSADDVLHHGFGLDAQLCVEVFHRHV